MIKRLLFSVFFIENCTMMKKIFRKKKTVNFPGLKVLKTTEITSCSVSETFFARKSHANKK